MAEENIGDEEEFDDPVDPVPAADPADPNPNPNPAPQPQETPEAKRARLQRQLDQHNKKYPVEAAPAPEAPAPKSGVLDLGAKAFLAANGIKGTKEYDFFETELKKAPGETVESLLENEYFQGKLEKFRALEQTANATPSGDNRSGGAAIDSVEYWMTKPFEEVPKDMRQKVVNAKLEKENNKGVFYNS